MTEKNDILIDPILDKDRFDFTGESLTEEDVESIEEESVTQSVTQRGLTPDQKRIHWETYAKKTERQEEVFKKVFDNVFNEQKDFVIAEFERIGKLPQELNDNLTAKKFEPAIELVYEGAFTEAI